MGSSMFVWTYDRRRYDLSPPRQRGSEDSVGAGDVGTRPRHQRRQAAKQLDRLQLELQATVGERALRADREASIGQHRQPFVREGRPRPIAAEPGQAFPIVGVQVDPGVEREAFEERSVLLGDDRHVRIAGERGDRAATNLRTARKEPNRSPVVACWPARAPQSASRAAAARGKSTGFLRRSQSPGTAGPYFFCGSWIISTHFPSSFLQRCDLM